MEAPQPPIGMLATLAPTLTLLHHRIQHTHTQFMCVCARLAYTVGKTLARAHHFAHPLLRSATSIQRAVVLRSSVVCRPVPSVRCRGAKLLAKSYSSILCVNVARSPFAASHKFQPEQNNSNNNNHNNDNNRWRTHHRAGIAPNRTERPRQRALYRTKRKLCSRHISSCQTTDSGRPNEKV